MIIGSVFSTTNRNLENFMHMHKVRFISQQKTPDALTEWSYIVTPRFVEVFDEYRALRSVEFDPATEV